MQLGVRRFVFASSGAPLAGNTPPISELSPAHPVAPYGASKLAGEQANRPVPANYYNGHWVQIVAGAGFGGLYLDANAIAPATAREVAGIVEGGGATFVDGGIIGPPPSAEGGTRLYLSGPRAAEVRRLFAGTDLDVRVLEGETTASALKMAYAGWTKGTAALILAVRGLARAANN